MRWIYDSISPFSSRSGCFTLTSSRCRIVAYSYRTAPCFGCREIAPRGSGSMTGSRWSMLNEYV